jgi:hypothetical protein
MAFERGTARPKICDFFRASSLEVGMDDGVNVQAE